MSHQDSPLDLNPDGPFIIRVPEIERKGKIGINNHFTFLRMYLMSHVMQVTIFIVSYWSGAYI